MDTKKIQENVKIAYGKVAIREKGCGCGPCQPNVKEFAKSIGYTEEELSIGHEDANLGLSCGNPIVLANLKAGETVLDLGSGAGFDCFIAATKVGNKGKVIGVDITPQMIEKAKDNALNKGTENVEFRLGEIENLPVADNCVDVVISNCVVNLSPDKHRVFKEIFRVLKPGGRIAISDIALLRKLPAKIRQDISAYIGCIAGAVTIDDYEESVKASGLYNVKITSKGLSGCFDFDTNDPLGNVISNNLEVGQSLAEYAISINVEGFKA